MLRLKQGDKRSKSPFREDKTRGSYINVVDDSREEAKQVRELEGLRVQLESENKTLLGQIGRLQAETKVVR